MWRRDGLAKMVRYSSQFKQPACEAVMMEHAAITNNAGVVAGTLRSKVTTSEQRTSGVKAVMLRLLAPYDKPVTAEELWEKAQLEGVKSKRQMKKTLQDLKKRKLAATKPANGKNWGYLLNRVKFDESRATGTSLPQEQPMQAEQSNVESSDSQDSSTFAQFARRWRS